MSEHIKESHTVLNDQSGNTAFVVIPWDEYQKAFDDEVIIPHEVVMLAVKHNCTLLGAWRRHKGLSQKDVSIKTGILQSSLSRMENEEGNYQIETLAKLSDALELRSEQLID